MRVVLFRICCCCAALLLLALLVGACSVPGGGRDLDEQNEPIDVDEGRQLFQTTCRVCHSLADARAAGTFGPDLDLLQPDAERVREQIDEGGGGMPPDLLEGEDADLVARYVAQVAGQGLEREGEGGTRGSTKAGEDG